MQSKFSSTNTFEFKTANGHEIRVDQDRPATLSPAQADFTMWADDEMIIDPTDGHTAACFAYSVVFNLIDDGAAKDDVLRELMDIAEVGNPIPADQEEEAVPAPWSPEQIKFALANLTQVWDESTPINQAIQDLDRIVKHCM